jgi:hypothetical protein
MHDSRLEDIIFWWRRWFDPVPWEIIKPTEEQIRRYVDLEVRMTAKMNEITQKALLDMQKIQVQRQEELGKIIGTQSR